MSTDERLERIELKLDLILAMLDNLCEVIEPEESEDGERDQTQPL